MSARKACSGWAGYVAQRKNALSKGYNVIVDTRKGGDWAACEDDGGRYVIICDAHSTLVQSTNLPGARASMKDATNFCDDCREIERLQVPA